MSPTLIQLIKTGDLALYEKTPEPAAATADSNRTQFKRFIASTPHSRQICNDPLLYGVKYTDALRDCCGTVLSGLAKANLLTASETSCVVLHVLRGGLNFGLREALHTGLSWNKHSSAFVSAQRQQKKNNLEEWIITESNYKKLSLKNNSDIVFGDVVATGTSLKYALEQLSLAAKKTRMKVSSLTFFTIGSNSAEEIVKTWHHQFEAENPSFKGSNVIYLEGDFAVASAQDKLKIKLDGTDLLRTGNVLSPEFIESQYEKASFPVERCTIYDAGSRAFDIKEYLYDVKEYWHQLLTLAKEGLGYSELVQERAPSLDHSRFPGISLEELCREQLQKIEHALS